MVYHLHVSEMNLPTELYRQHFCVIKERFFSHEPIVAFTEYLGTSKQTFRKAQLSAILSLISDFALESILFGHDKSKFQPQTLFKSLQTFVTNENL